jgi:histidine triad (HIT) family protein
VFDCVFCKILKKEIPSNKIYEDALCYAFTDIAPKAPIHYVFIPKEHFAGTWEITEAREKVAGHLLRAAALVAEEKKIDKNGYRLIFNANSDAGQTVFHLHMHLLAGWKLEDMG